MSYRFTVPKDGLYKLERTKQNTNVGMASLRDIRLMGASFAEARALFSLQRRLENYGVR